MSGSSIAELRGTTWVITGGAGYLGRALLLRLRAAGVNCFVLDNFSTSHKRKDSDLFDVDLVDNKASLAAWKKIQSKGPIHGVFHFAAFALVGESREKPDVYLENNLMSALQVARLCSQSAEPPVIIHSSSCAVYGTPTKLPITEESTIAPISPYGASKKLAEEVLNQVVMTKSLRITHLRYFNPCGALEDGSHGEAHEPETHLIPNAIQAALKGTPVQVFGNDYPTPDGTCLRDYFHLEDLVEAHACAALYLKKQAAGHIEAVNIGAGKSLSVKQVIAAVEEVSGKKIQVQYLPRRVGDPAHLEASISKAKKLLQWSPQRSIQQAISSHMTWLKTLKG